jgi:molybdopterin-guanine dinucleotide biosynthesis protein A
MNGVRFFVVILAGGKSARFGSNKALFEIDGVPILVHEIREVTKISFSLEMIFLSVHNPQQWTIIKNSLQKSLQIRILNENKQIYHAYSEKLKIDIKLQITFDTYSQHPNISRTPLLGLLSVFESIIRTYSDGLVQVIPCDMPYFNSSIINKLLAKCWSERQNLDGLLLKWADDRIEPLNSIYRARVFYPIVQKNIQEQKYRLRNLFNSTLKLIDFLIDDELAEYSPEFHPFRHLNENPFY